MPFGFGVGFGIRYGIRYGVGFGCLLSLRAFADFICPRHNIFAILLPTRQFGRGESAHRLLRKDRVLKFSIEEGLDLGEDLGVMFLPVLLENVLKLPESVRSLGADVLGTLGQVRWHGVCTNKTAYVVSQATYAGEDHLVLASVVAQAY